MENIPNNINKLNNTPYETKNLENDFIPEEIMSTIIFTLDNLMIDQPISIQMNLCEILSILHHYEDVILDFINNNSHLDPFKTKILKEFVYNIFDQIIEKETYFKIDEIKKHLQKTLDKLINTILNEKESFKKKFSFLDDKNIEVFEINLKIEETLINTIDHYFIIYHSLLVEESNLNTIPEYLISNTKEKLRIFLFELISINFYSDYYEKYKLEQTEVKLMNFFLQSLISNKIELFDLNDKSYYSRESIECLYKIFIISNIDYLEDDPISKIIFEQNIPKYSKLMKLDNHLAMDIFQFYQTIFKRSYFLGKDIIEKDQFDTKKELADLFDDFLKLTKSQEVYFMVIFSFSLMLNNIINFKQNKIAFDHSFSVNARERQFLINFLKSLNNYCHTFNCKSSHKNLPFHLNGIVESFIAKNIIKELKIKIFDFDENYRKYEIDHNLITKIISEVEFDNSNKLNEINSNISLNKLQVDDNNKIQYNENEFEHLSIDHSENDEEEKELNKKILERHQKIKPDLKVSGMMDKIYSFINSFVSINMNNKESAKLEIDKIKIKPLNNHVFSLNSSLFFSGFLSEGMDNITGWRFFKFSLDEHKEMHSYEWPAFNYFNATNQVIEVFGKVVRICNNFKNGNFISLMRDMANFMNIPKNNIFIKANKIAKLSGKILALLIARRKIFRIHSLNLIGFSLGCQVIKSFLKELYKLAENEKSKDFKANLVNIIQNIVFIGGAIDFKNKKKWGQIFQTLIAGKVLNIYSNNDEILKKLYKLSMPMNDPIGLRKIILGDCNKIENYDVTNLNEGHLDYRNSFDLIMEKVNFEI